LRSALTCNDFTAHGYRKDAITAAGHNAHIAPMWTVGGTVVCAAIGLREADFMSAWVAACPWAPGAMPAEHYLPLARPATARSGIQTLLSILIWETTGETY
jgi:hypothetical protein